MKRVKKILSMILCSVVIVSGSNLSLIKANAQTVYKSNVSIKQVNSRSVAKQSDDKWVTKITLRFRHKLFTFDRFLWGIELACNKDNVLVLRGNTKIPRYYTFDDIHTDGVMMLEENLVQFQYLEGYIILIQLLYFKKQ